MSAAGRVLLLAAWLWDGDKVGTGARLKSVEALALAASASEAC